MTKHENVQAAEDVFGNDVVPGALSLDELNLTFDTGLPYYSEEEKDAHIAAGTRFVITDVDYEEAAKFGPRWLVWLRPVDAPTQMPKAWAFSAGPDDQGNMAATTIQRNAGFEKLHDMQVSAGGRPIGPIYIAKAGRARVIRSAAASVPSEAPADF